MHEIFGSILAVEEECLGKEISVPEMLELILTVNSVLQVSLLLLLSLLCFSGLTNNLHMLLCLCRPS